jgi:hypothetical protein
MPLTNKYNFPEAIVRAVSKYEYTGNNADITASRLGMPPRIVALEKMHRHEIVEDVSSLMHVLLGSAVHNILEKSAPAGHLIEERMSTEVLGWSLSGQPDSLEIREGSLIDWKTSRVDSFQIKVRENFKEWTQQLNTYRWILHKNDIEVKSLGISAFLVDWSPSVALRQKDYPPHAMPQVPIEMWPLSYAETYVKDRILLHQSAQSAKEIPSCTDNDRWKSDRWAIMQKGKKKASKTFDSEESAFQALPEYPGGWVEKRPGQARRCLLYCSVSKFCDQWASDPDNHTADLEALYPAESLIPSKEEQNWGDN